MYTYLYVYMCMFIRNIPANSLLFYDGFRCICMCILHVCMNDCVHKHMNMCSCKCIYVHVPVRMYICVHVRMYVCMYAYIYIYIYIVGYIHIYIFNTPANSSLFHEGFRPPRIRETTSLIHVCMYVCVYVCMCVCMCV